MRDKILRELGANPTISDPCVFQIGSGGESMIIAIYVDDILIASKHQEAVTELSRKLSRFFDLKDLGYAKCCLGIEITQGEDNILINQQGYVQEILERFGMSESKPVSTPLETGTKLTKNLKPSKEDLKIPYRELIGALTYLSISTRPDIAFAISSLGQFNNCYGEEHWKAAKRVLRYLKGTSEA